VAKEGSVRKELLCTVKKKIEPGRKAGVYQRGAKRKKELRKRCE